MSVEAPTWARSAACAGTDPEAFHDHDPSVERVAKSICHACPVRAACLAEALDREEPYGVWGGTSPRDRRELLRTRSLVVQR